MSAWGSNIPTVALCNEKSSQGEVVHHKSNSLNGVFALHTWLSNVPKRDLKEDLES